MINQIEENPFAFVGETLVLDFINTVVVIRGKRRDLLETPEDLARWWELVQQHQLIMDEVANQPATFDESLLTSAKEFRASLHHLFSSVVEGKQPQASALEGLNNILGMGRLALQWQTDRPPKPLYWNQDNPHSVLLLPVALSALRLLTEADLTRLHKCHNDRCILLFYDTTKSGTRQWCSTACLDRERSIKRYRARQGM